MGELVNLNKYRKARQRLDDNRRAMNNREKFGRSKAETERGKRERRLDDETLDGKKLEPDGDERA
jgi:Domain of unknown function (DUF4169)